MNFPEFFHEFFRADAESLHLAVQLRYEVLKEVFLAHGEDCLLCACRYEIAESSLGEDDVLIL